MGLNNYTERWTKDVTLKLYYSYPSNYSVFVNNISYNPQDVQPEIKEFNGFYVTFTWDLIQEKRNGIEGRINLVFDVILHNQNGPILSSIYPLIYKIKVEDVGEYTVNETGIIIHW